MNIVYNLGAVIIANAIVWGVVIIGCSFALKGTGGYDLIQNYLGAGAAVTSVIILSGILPYIIKIKKLNDANKDQPAE